MKKELIISSISQLMILIFNFLSYKLVLIFFGKNAFLDYSMLKRFLAFLYPLSTLGMGVIIPKFVSFYSKNLKKILLIVFSALIIVGVFNIVLILFLFLFSEYLSREIIKNQHFVDYLFSIILMIVWYSIFIIQVGLLRGLYKISYANIIQLISLVIVPLAFLFISNSFRLYLLLTYSSLILISLISLYIFYKRYFVYKQKIHFYEFLVFFKKLLFYGIQRVPADLGLSLMFLLPVLFYSNQYGYEKGGCFAFAMSLFFLMGTIFSPFNFVILPKVGILLAERNLNIIKKYIYKTIFFSFLYSILVVFLFYTIGLEVLQLYIGELSIEVYSILKYLVWGIFGYSMFVALRGFIDALYEKGVNSVVVLASLLSLLTISYFNIYNMLYFPYSVMGVIILIFLYLKLTKG